MDERKKERALMPYNNSECSDQPVDSEGTNQAELMSRLRTCQVPHILQRQFLMTRLACCEGPP